MTDLKFLLKAKEPINPFRSCLAVDRIRVCGAHLGLSWHQQFDQLIMAKQLKKMQKPSDAVAAGEGLAEVGQTLNNSAHGFVMQEIWNFLWGRPDLASKIYIMCRTGSFDNKQQGQPEIARTLSTNNKYVLAPRDIFDDVLKRKCQQAFVFFEKRVKQDVADYVCYHCNLDPASAVHTKVVSALVNHLCAQWDANARFTGFPDNFEATVMKTMGYFTQAQVTEGGEERPNTEGEEAQAQAPPATKTELTFTPSGQKATLPAELQKGANWWKIDCNMNYKRASIKHGEWESHTILNIFKRQGIDLHTAPVFLKNVPTDASPAKKQRTNDEAWSPASTRSGGSLASASGSAGLASAGSSAGSAAEPPPPPPPPGSGNA